MLLPKLSIGDHDSIDGRYGLRTNSNGQRTLNQKTARTGPLHSRPWRKTIVCRCAPSSSRQTKSPPIIRQRRANRFSSTGLNGPTRRAFSTRESLFFPQSYARTTQHCSISKQRSALSSQTPIVAKWPRIALERSKPNSVSPNAVGADSTHSSPTCVNESNASKRETKKTPSSLRKRSRYRRQHPGLLSVSIKRS